MFLLPMSLQYMSLRSIWTKKEPFIWKMQGFLRIPTAHTTASAKLWDILVILSAGKRETDGKAPKGNQNHTIKKGASAYGNED